MRTKAAPWDYERQPKPDPTEYETSLCASCLGYVIYDVDGKAICSNCGDGVEVVKVPQLQVREWRKDNRHCNLVIETVAPQYQTEADADRIREIVDGLVDPMYMRHPEIFGGVDPHEVEWLDEGTGGSREDYGFGRMGPF